MADGCTQTLVEVWVDLLAMEDVACDAYAEAVTWRQLALVTLAELHRQFVRASRAEERLRQVMGIEDWHPDGRQGI